MKKPTIRAPKSIISLLMLSAYISLGSTAGAAEPQQAQVLTRQQIEEKFKKLNKDLSENSYVFQTFYVNQRYDGADEPNQPLTLPEFDRKPAIQNIGDSIVIEAPVFQGGENELYKFISANIRYPEECVQNNVSGSIIAQFTVDTTGQVTNVKIIRGRHPSLDKEVLALVKNFPPFTPEKTNGTPTSCVCTVPVVFKLFKP